MTAFASESFYKSAVEEAPESSLVFLDLQLGSYHDKTSIEHYTYNDEVSGNVDKIRV